MWPLGICVLQLEIYLCAASVSELIHLHLKQTHSIVSLCVKFDKKYTPIFKSRRCLILFELFTSFNFRYLLTIRWSLHLAKRTQSAWMKKSTIHLRLIGQILSFHIITLLLWIHGWRKDFTPITGASGYEIPGVYNSQNKSFEIHDPAWVVAGGGKFEIDRKKRLLRLYDDSMAYGKFDRKGLNEKILSIAEFSNYTVQIDSLSGPGVSCCMYRSSDRSALYFKGI